MQLFLTLELFFLNRLFIFILLHKHKIKEVSCNWCNQQYDLTAHFYFRTEVKEKAAELDVLKDTMASEQKKSRELQWALEKEKAKMERSEERRREELEVFLPYSQIAWNIKEHADSFGQCLILTYIFVQCVHVFVHVHVLNSSIVPSRAEKRSVTL